MHSAAGKLAVAGNGRGGIVGCLQQYRKRRGFVRMASSRAAWPHTIHGKQQQQQQRRSHGEIRSGCFVSRFFFLVRQHRGAGRTGLVAIGGVFAGMDDELVFTMDTPVDRNYFFDRIILGLLFAARVEKK